MAAAYKFVTEAALVEATTHRLTSQSLLSTKQGLGRSRRPFTIRSRCLSRVLEPRERGEGRAMVQRAISGNTRPAVKLEGQSFDRLKPRARFVAMWRNHRVDTSMPRSAPTLRRPRLEIEQFFDCAHAWSPTSFSSGSVSQSWSSNSDAGQVCVLACRLAFIGRCFI